MTEDLNAVQNLIFSPVTFRDHWTMILGMSSVTATLITLFGFLRISRQLKLQKDQIVKAETQLELLQASEVSQLFVLVMDRWTQNYKIRNKLLKARPKTLNSLIKKFPTAAHLLSSSEWMEVRSVLNFFEFLGVLLSNEKFDQDGVRERIFTLVTVDVYPETEESFGLDDGEFYLRMKPYLDFLRFETGYRPDIYEYYDSYLLTDYVSHLNRSKGARK
jgi:hypothetical protein